MQMIPYNYKKLNRYSVYLRGIELKMEKPLKILLIVNPVSGRQKARVMLYSIVNFLSQNKCTTTIFSTTCRGHATDIVKEHAGNHDRIICCGGDGTLNEVFSGLAIIGTTIPVGYIPTGTTNDLAHALGLTSNIKMAMHLALYGNNRALDLGTFNDNQYFSYVASFGAFSKVAYETPQWLKNRLGRASYFFYGISEIADIRSYEVRITADEQQISGNFVYGSVSNSNVIGGLVKFPENSISLDDGKFEVMLIRTPKGPIDLHHIVQGLVNHEYNDDSVLFFTASNIVFEFIGDTVPWTVDGEYAGENYNVSISNMHRKACILVE